VKLPRRENALFWLEQYPTSMVPARGRRSSSMLYRTKPCRGEWVPQPDGGQRTKSPIAFTAREMNLDRAACPPGALVIAEDPTALPKGQSPPCDEGGLGFRPKDGQTTKK